jgi:hypothetical protein
MALAVAVFAGSAEAASVSPSSKDYGSEPVGSSSAPTIFTLQTSPNQCLSTFPMTSTCNSSVTYFTDTSALGAGPGATATSGDFVIRNINCAYPSSTGGIPLTLGPSPPTVCQFEASFLPTTTGALATSLTFTDTGGPTATVALAGTGVPPTVRPVGPPAHKRCKHKHRHASAAKKCKKHH